MLCSADLGAVLTTQRATRSHCPSCILIYQCLPTPYLPLLQVAFSSQANISQRLPSALQPSFNGALASDPSLPASSAQFNCVMNTVLSLIGACLSAFALSAAYHGKLDMVHIQNSTLAGGVAIGSAANMDMAPAAALGGGHGGRGSQRPGLQVGT